MLLIKKVSSCRASCCNSDLAAALLRTTLNVGLPSVLLYSKTTWVMWYITEILPSPTLSAKEESGWLQPGAVGFFRALLGRLESLLGATGLLCLQVLVEEVEGGLISLGRAHDGEHALARFVMGTLSVVLIIASTSLFKDIIQVLH